MFCSVIDIQQCASARSGASADFTPGGLHAGAEVLPVVDVDLSNRIHERQQGSSYTLLSLFTPAASAAELLLLARAES